MVVVNTATSYIIKPHGFYVLFPAVLLVIGVTEHWGQCSRKGEGSVIALVKNPCNKINKANNNQGHGTCIPSWLLSKNITMGITHDKLMAMEIGKGNGKGFEKEKWHLLAFIYENNWK